MLGIYEQLVAANRDAAPPKEPPKPADLLVRGSAPHTLYTLMSAHPDGRRAVWTVHYVAAQTGWSNDRASDALTRLSKRGLIEVGGSDGRMKAYRLTTTGGPK